MRVVQEGIKPSLGNRTRSIELPQRFEAILIGACESQRVEASVCSHLVARSGVILCISPQSESSTYFYVHIWYPSGVLVDVLSSSHQIYLFTLRLKKKINCSRSSAPNPARVAYDATPDLQSDGEGILRPTPHNDIITSFFLIGQGVWILWGSKIALSYWQS